MFLVDASVWIAAKDGGDRYFEPARSMVIDPRRPVGVLDLTFYEVANGLGARRGHHSVARELCRTIADRCEDRILAVDAALIGPTLELAEKHGLTAYDAAYVVAARRRSWTLVSCDVADLVSKGLAVTPDDADYP